MKVCNSMLHGATYICLKFSDVYSQPLVVLTMCPWNFAMSYIVTLMITWILNSLNNDSHQTVSRMLCTCNTSDLLVDLLLVASW